MNYTISTLPQDKQWLLDNPTVFLQILLNTAKAGEISLVQFEQILSAAGFSKTSSGDWVRDSRSDFEKWLHNDFGPTLAKIAGLVVSLGAVNEISNNKSNSSTESGEHPDVFSDTSKAITETDNSDSGLWSWLKGLIGDNAPVIGSALAGLAGQMGSSILNYENQKKLIDYQNEYNTPKNQMARFAQAGLNPNLIYGLGTNGNQPSSGSIAPVDFDTSQRENRMAQLQFGLQAKQVEADISQKQAYTRLLDSENEGVSEDIIAKRFANSTYVEQYNAQLSNILAQTNKYVSDLQVNLATIKEKLANVTESSARSELINAQRETENRLREARIEQTRAQAQLYRSQSNSVDTLLPQQLRLTQNQASAIPAQLKLSAGEYSASALERWFDRFSNWKNFFGKYKSIATFSK